ncbi:hypothetical protein D9M68_661060 [compost metagenome]
MNQCSSANSPPPWPSSRAASLTIAASTSATLASKQLARRAGSLSSLVTDSQATSKLIATSSRRQASRVLVLPLPADPRIATQRCLRASIRRLISAARGISWRAPRGGITLVSGMSWSTRSADR